MTNTIDIKTLDKNKTVCFTGPRAKKLCGWKHEPYRSLIDGLVNTIIGLTKQGYENFITGGAQGFDQLAFWAVHKAKTKHGCKIKNIVFVPFEGQDSVWGEDGCFGRKEYRLMLKLADGIHVCGPKDNNISRRLMLRNHTMVNASGLVVALYGNENGYKTATSGGTEACMKYADTRNVPIMILGYDIHDGILELR